MNEWEMLQAVLQRQGFRSYEIVGLLKELMVIANSFKKASGEVGVVHKLNTMKKKIGYIEEEFKDQKVYRYGKRLEDMDEKERAKYE